MTRTSVLGFVGTAALAAVISVSSIALADGGSGPPRLLGSGTAAAADTMAVGGDVPESGAADAKRSASDMRIAGRVEYRVAGALPALDGELVAWRFAEPTSATGIDVGSARALARSLGLEGDGVVNEWGDWVVTTSTRQLTVSAQPGNPWYLSLAPVESPPEEIVAEEPTTDVSEGGGSSGSAGSEPGVVAPDGRCDPCPEPQRPAGLPTQAAAEQQGRKLLAELGVDLSTATVRVDDGFSAWYVSAAPTIGGLPVIGMDSSVSIGVDGVVEYANGWLGRPVRGDTYPLIGTSAAIEKLQEQPQPHALMMEGPASSSAQVRCMDCPVSDDGGSGEVPVFVHTITGARLAYQVLGADLVPTYLLETDQGGELQAFAVDDRYLDIPQYETMPVEDMPAVEPKG